MTPLDLAAIGSQSLKRTLATQPWFLTGIQQDPTGLLKKCQWELTEFLEVNANVSFQVFIELGFEGNSTWLSRTLESLSSQTYSNWLCTVLGTDQFVKGEPAAYDDTRVSFSKTLEIRDSLPQSGAQFVIKLRAGEVLHPQALGVFFRTQCDHADAICFTSHEVIDRRELGAGIEFYSKSRPNQFDLLRGFSFGRGTCWKREFLLNLSEDSLKSVNWEFNSGVFGKLTASGAFVALPLFLINSPYSKDLPQMFEKELEELDLFIRKQAAAFYGDGKFLIRHAAQFYSVLPKEVGRREQCGTAKRRVVVIVPYRDQPALTLSCLSHLVRQKFAGQIRVVLIDNGSDIKTKELIASQIDSLRNNVVQFEFAHMSYDRHFHFARMNNEAVTKYSDVDDLLFFLNNDVDLISPEVIETLASEIEANEKVGFAGIRLDFPGQQNIQHGGIGFLPRFVGPGLPTIGHGNDRLQHFPEFQCVKTGVTFAAAMVSRSRFDELGRLEERWMPVGFGDVDLNLKAIEAGYVNVYFGDLIGIHHESLTRGVTAEELEYMQLNRLHRQSIEEERLFFRDKSYFHSLCNAGLLVQFPDHFLARMIPPKPLRYKLVDRLNSWSNSITPALRKPIRNLLARLTR